MSGYLLATDNNNDDSNMSQGEASDNSDDNGDDDLQNNDAEGIWSADIEQSFLEALAIYPPCGRRKIILSEEGKMYGRNELIARYIKLRTGKTRTRKQVSSHIQVLARRKSKEIQSQIKDQTSKDRLVQSLASMSSSQIVSATALQDKGSRLGMGGGCRMNPAVGHTYPPPPVYNGSEANRPYAPMDYNCVQDKSMLIMAQPGSGQETVQQTGWQGRTIAGPKLRLTEFTAFVEYQKSQDMYLERHNFVYIGNGANYADQVLETVDMRQVIDKFPDRTGGLRDLYDQGPQSAFFLVKFWADLNTNLCDDIDAFYGSSTQYESSYNMTITSSTMVCSFGKQVVEKVETEYARCEFGRYVYRVDRSCMCEYMVNFINKLRHLPEKYMMNSVLENFTVLQVVRNQDTQETLLCIAYIFEISNSEHGSQRHIYRLAIKD